KIEFKQNKRLSKLSSFKHTARYSFYSFLPLFLYDQFSKLANQIPGVSPVGRFITLVPLFILLSVSAFKEAIEDIFFQNIGEERYGARLLLVTSSELLQIKLFLLISSYWPRASLRNRVTYKQRALMEKLTTKYEV
ncbi:hypothetical protein MXB_157, partial [Myxobolus squamalis]